MFFSRRKRQQLRREIAASLERTRETAESRAKELALCGALLAIKSEQLEAAEAVNDEVTGREIMSEMRPLLAERDRLIAREKAFNDQLEKQLTKIQEATQDK